jgi:predicted N-acetyltransferase YhbS
VKPPAPLTPTHDLQNFDCGNAVMNDWLRKRAGANQESGATRTFVVCDDENKVLGYYALAVGSCERDYAPSNLSRGMPDPIPMVILARLAIDRSCQRLGLGRHLIADAVMRTLHIAEQAGVRGLLVSAIDDAAAAYYQRLGFIPAKQSEAVLMLRLSAAKDVIAKR